MFMRAHSLPWLIAVLAAVYSVSGAGAQNAIERMVSPGELISGHAKFEKDCSECHKPFSRSSQNQLCLDCHKELAADVRDKTGFHGRRKDVAANACSHCHTDHKGRSADIIQFDALTFDHTITDFALDGAHATVKCDACHLAGKKFRQAPLLCSDCHKASDPHMGRLGEKCEGATTPRRGSRRSRSITTPRSSS